MLLVHVEVESVRDDLLRQYERLNLQIEAIPEDFLEIEQFLLCLVEPPLLDETAEQRTDTCRRDEQALVVFFQKRKIAERAPVVLAVTRGQRLDGAKVLPALRVHRDDDEMVLTHVVGMLLEELRVLALERGNLLLRESVEDGEVLIFFA